MPRGETLPYVKLDDKLRAIVGGCETEIAATELVKRMWVYIKANNLKGQSKKRPSLILPPKPTA